MPNVPDASGKVVQEVQDAEQAYAATGPLRSQLTADASPVLGGEPALVLGTVGGVVVAVLSLTHVLTVDTATGFIASLTPIISAITTRFFVKPLLK